MSKIIIYINENEIPKMVKYITEDSKKDVWEVITKIKEDGAAFIRKSQALVNELYKHLPDYEVGMVVEAQEDCMNNFRKGQRLEITAVTEEGVVLEGLAELYEKEIRTHFKVVGTSDCL